MSTLFASLLIAHVILGLVGAISSFIVAFLLLKPIASVRLLRWSAITATITYILSWISGGWYYWKYYGTVVKPVIISGKYPWAHSIFTETKEHLFMFLPFAALCVFLLVYFGADELQQNEVLRKRSATLALVVFVIAVVVTLSGVLITGGAR